MKMLKKSAISILCTSLLMILCGGGGPVYGQVKEPDVKGIQAPLTPTQKGYTNRIGGALFVNNFGIGIGGMYSHALSPFTELTFSVGVTGIRDVSEQSTYDFFTGQRASPNKYNRALGFPFMVGLKKRIFPKQITDNFRFFVAASAGPAMAFVYPYFDDTGNNGLAYNDNYGYRSSRIINTIFGPQSVYTERKKSFFGGWGDGHTKWGGAGAIKVGVDLGSNFKRQSTLEIGYFFYYFGDGLQLMDPYKPVGYDQDTGNTYGQKPFFDSQKFFGTPQIKFTFSGWW